jgi:hypothetical protein
MLFYYPMTALLTVFEHVICDPCNNSAKNDIALMEVVVGFFGRLEYLTSGVAAFTKTAEVVKQARIAMEHAQEDNRSAAARRTGSLTAPKDTAFTWGSNDAATRQEPVPPGTVEQMGNGSLPSELSFGSDAPTMALDGLADIGTDTSTWSLPWDFPLEDQAEHDTVPSAWTHMETSLPANVSDPG